MCAGYLESLLNKQQVNQETAYAVFQPSAGENTKWSTEQDKKTSCDWRTVHTAAITNLPYFQKEH